MQKRKACDPPLEEAEQAYTIAQSRFKMNAIAESDVMQTKLLFFRAKLTCLHALYDVKASEAELNKAVGK